MYTVSRLGAVVPLDVELREQLKKYRFPNCSEQHSPRNDTVRLDTPRSDLFEQHTERITRQKLELESFKSFERTTASCNSNGTYPSEEDHTDTLSVMCDGEMDN
jgi:hypothetical protein